MFQTGSERAFDLWVKTIAIELIRQTPLDSVKYLDILTLTECWNRKNSTDYGENDSAPARTEENDKREITKSSARVLYDVNRNPVAPNKPETSPVDSKDTVDSRVPRLEHDEKAVEVLLKKCQNPESYVPVKEKLMLFESLCRLGRKVRSTEDVTFKIDMESKRARSLHDLSNCVSTHIAVREICKYFENKGEDGERARSFPIANRKNRRLVNSDSQLNNVQRHFHNVSFA